MVDDKIALGRTGQVSSGAAKATDRRLPQPLGSWVSSGSANEPGLVGDHASVSDDDIHIPWVRVGARRRRFVDGGGRASLGRLFPEDRIEPPLCSLADILRQESCRRGLVDRLQHAARSAEVGKEFENPFEVTDVDAIRNMVIAEVVGVRNLGCKKYHLGSLGV